MKRFKVTVWVYTVNIDNHNYPTCDKHEFTVDAHDEKHAEFRACFRFNFWGIQKMDIVKS